MSGLLFLNNDDFYIQRGTKGSILCTNMQGFSLVLFYSTQCSHCQSLIPIFKKLPGTIGGCQFGMINVSQNKKCVLMSRETIAPIKEVPYILFYVNGKPYMRYKGPHDSKEISRFILEIAQKVRSNQNMTKNDDNNKKQGNSIPEYALGHPLCGKDDKVCYLDFNGAYSKNNVNNNSGMPRQQLPSVSGMNR